MTITTHPQLTDLTAGTWSVEPAHSEVGFSVRHLGLSKVRGRFNSFAGSAEIADDPTASTLAATVDLASIDTNNEDRDNHLRSTDFFAIEAHPTMSFEATEITPDHLAGTITIAGVSKPIAFDLEFHGVAVDMYETTRAGFSASGELRRSDFGIDFNAPLGVDGMLIGDKISIELEIQLVPAS